MARPLQRKRFLPLLPRSSQRDHLLHARSLKQIAALLISLETRKHPTRKVSDAPLSFGWGRVEAGNEECSGGRECGNGESCFGTNTLLLADLATAVELLGGAVGFMIVVNQWLSLFRRLASPRPWAPHSSVLQELRAGTRHVPPGNPSPDLPPLFLRSRLPSVARTITPDVLAVTSTGLSRGASRGGRESRGGASRGEGRVEEERVEGGRRSWPVSLGRPMDDGRAHEAGRQDVQQLGRLSNISLRSSRISI